jgi:hypothetical protein
VSAAPADDDAVGAASATPATRLSPVAAAAAAQRNGGAPSSASPEAEERDCAALWSGTAGLYSATATLSAVAAGGVEGALPAREGEPRISHAALQCIANLACDQVRLVMFFRS